MRQVWIPRPGPPEVLELRECADPDPGPGDVRIRVEAAGVSFGDVAGRLGIYRQMPPPPLVPGFEVAGRIDAVGDEVPPDWIGRDVLGLTQYGGYADTVCTPEFRVQPRPAGMTAQEGAALPVNYLTAYLLVERMGGLRADETVLIHGAGGGVGTACVQVARRIGARVIGPEPAREIARAFVQARFSAEERHVRRIGKVRAIEQRYLREGATETMGSRKP